MSIKIYYYKSDIIHQIQQNRHNRIFYIGGCFMFCSFIGFISNCINFYNQNEEYLSFGTSLLFLFIFWGLLFFFHFLISRVENVTILCADDVIVMSENEINLFKKEHLISSLQRNQLNITYRYYAAGSAIFDMWNLSDPSKKITFTSHLNDFEHLVNSIIPNFWPPEMG